ncbi:MAG: hypothetical protein WBJ36_07950 [Tenuifilum sp.]|uniref:hypothetical protein n=1 Tax=Tenuifilum sp. TaxID=2760880 RepID=UPI00168DE3A1|nr:hypothetical protein [Bacteroidales bacterium]NLJ38389.1 hypothetical protein [Candidatus Atribacteria bacterium]HOK86549.1 hypothetical protein [Tenuifilum sp.]HPD59683.1 hypothetical protein [Paludibacteraceae bacterium]MBP9029883.1 hypothetical protein [Bacteroidales bacterium]
MENDDEKRILLDLRKQSESEFEKLIIYVASGGLVLTITFSEKILSIDKNGQFLNWLISTWILFALTIVISLVFHLTSIKAFDLKLLEEDSISDKWNRATKLLHFFSVFLLILGIASFIIYAILSINCNK